MSQAKREKGGRGGVSPRGPVENGTVITKEIKT